MTLSAYATRGVDIIGPTNRVLGLGVDDYVQGAAERIHTSRVYAYN